jgi:hypothetical protein
MAEDTRRAADDPDAEDELERGETGIRILITLLFVLIATALETVLSVVIAFELLWALITRLPPSPRVRDFANRVVGYYYRIGRYMTYNDARPPFPFSDFPAPPEGDGWDASVRPSESLGIADPHR